MTVSGYSGAGISALVQQAQQHIVELGGHFLSGQYDNFHHMELLSAIIVALTDYAILANALPSIYQCFDVPPMKITDVGLKGYHSQIRFNAFFHFKAYLYFVKIGYLHRFCMCL